MKNWGIQKRILFLAVVPLALIISVITAHYLLTRLEERAQVLEERGSAIARGLAPASEYGVLAGNHAILEGLARAAVREKDVLSVTITDLDGQVLAQAQSEEAAGNIHDIALWAALFPSRRHVFRAPIYQSQVRVVDLGAASAGVSAGARPDAPPVEPVRPIGWVTVELTDATLRSQQGLILAESLAIALVGLLLTAWLAWRMAGGVSRPILALQAAVQRIRQGDLSYRVRTGSGGELGELEAGINAMAESLREAREREEKQAADALYQEKVRAQVTLASIGDGVITTDKDGRVVYMNPVAEQYLGWHKEDASGRRLAEVFRIFDETANAVVEYPLHHCLVEGRTIRHDSHHLLVGRGGKRIEIQDSAAPIRDRTGRILGAVVVFHDVSEIQGMARRMAYLASHDPLTGLLNRREFETRLERALESARTEGRTHALCYLDLDQFKIVNDTSGHIAGDELLKMLAHHLQKEIRVSDVLARLGGDEFGVILEDCSIDKARRIADGLRRSIKDFRFVWQNRSFEVGVSIGLVPITAESGSLTDVLAAADSACYVAKDHGRNRIHVYQIDDAALAQRQGEMQWVQRLRQGLDDDGFDLYAQAIIPLAPGRGREREHLYEILLRVQDSELVTPETFIPAAERYHLMPAIDRWVVDRSLCLLARYYATPQADPNLRFAINLSGQSLGDTHFLDYVVECFVRRGVRPANVCFEITETAAIANLSRAREFIAQLKRMGCLFALDDFGSGLSSFGYLKSLPVDYIKIAGDFIKDMSDDPVALAMVDAINQIGHVMGLGTIAESVDGDGTVARLRDLGVDYGQGCGIAPPRPLHELLGLKEDDWHAVRRRGAHAAG
jgi:diguanylate cyclase (GGDEF)-like protein/PAS domain S-box-containing protein